MRECAESFLRTHGILPSPQRIAVYRFLRDHPIHASVDTIFRAVRKDLASISRMTVYNTVKRLVAAEVVAEVIIEDGELRYDADMRPHGHCKCTGCGAVFDMFPPAGELPVAELSGLPDGFLVTSVHLCCRGLCRECRERRGRARTKPSPDAIPRA